MTEDFVFNCAENGKPDWGKFVALELSAGALHDEAGSDSIEVVWNLDDADVITLYGCYQDGNFILSEALHDFLPHQLEYAVQLTQELVARHGLKGWHSRTEQIERGRLFFQNRY